MNKLLLWIIGAFSIIIILYISYNIFFNSNKGTTFEGYDSKMIEQCKSMPNMNWCKEYTKSIIWWANDSKYYNPIELNQDDVKNSNKVSVIELKDWDVYEMVVTKVIKEIWNSKVVMFAYNGSVPWPIIKVKKGSEITIKFTNKVKEIDTTLHSHWIRIENKYDGVPKSMNWNQKAIKYWDTFVYKVKFKDEWIYWYHPHVREDLQMELWLYWNYLVNPETDEYWSKVNTEETIILDDILIENDKIAPIANSFSNYLFSWRYWNTMLINWDANYSLNVKKWETVRLYFTNSSNTRVYNVNIPWVKMKLVWSDMSKYENETYVNNFIISPAERYVVELYFEKPWNYKIQNVTPSKTYVLWNINVSNAIDLKNYKKEFDTLRKNKDIISDIDNYREYFDKPVDKNLILAISQKWIKWWMYSMWDMLEWNKDFVMDWIEYEDANIKLNKMSNSKNLVWKIIDKDTLNENMDINWNFKVWDKVKVKIFNDSNTLYHIQHPIHFHWQRFLVINRNWVRQTNLVWKDTVLVKEWESVDILIDVTNPGDWMAHCHIAEHLTWWMMMNFNVKK